MVANQNEVKDVASVALKMAVNTTRVRGGINGGGHDISI